MHILILNQTFYPDVASTGQLMWDLARHLAKNGHRVSAVTSRTFYGSTDKHDKAFEQIDGVNIHRVSQTNFGKSKMIGRMCDFASFYVSAFRELQRLPAPDVILALSSPPMVSALGMWQKMFRTGPAGKPVRLVYHVMDLYPDAAIESGVMSQNSLIARFMRLITGRTLDLSDAVIALGHDMKDRILREYPRHAKPERIEVIQPWADGQSLRPIDKSDNPLARQLHLADTFNVVYSGNLGVAHDMDTITAAIELTLYEPKIAWLFIGGGKRFDVLRQKASRGFWKRVHFLPFQDRDKLVQSLNLADVHLISQLPAFTGVVVPSKLFGIMAVGKPSIMIGPADAECSRILADSHSGFVVNNGDAHDLVAKINQLRYDPAARRSMGERARAAFEQNFDRDVSCDKIQDLLERVCAK